MGAQGKPPVLVCNSISCPSPSAGADGWEGEQVELAAPSLPLRERQWEKKNQSAIAQGNRRTGVKAWR